LRSPLRLAPIAAFVLTGAALPFPALAQSRAAVELERREFAEWLRTSPLSPRRAVVVRPIGTGLSLGPASADIPLDGVEPGRISERQGRIWLREGDRDIAFARGRAVSLGSWRLLASGPSGRGVVTVFSPRLRAGKEPSWFPYDTRSAYSVVLAPSKAPGSTRLLTPDGIEVDATESGTVSVAIGGKPATLVVRRIPGATEEESELEIYFRDGSNGQGSYPAGRFVTLIPHPGGGGRYLLDFNRARNPFCAYNTVFPCPAPWRGNSLPVAVRAGERYLGGGLDLPPPG